VTAPGPTPATLAPEQLAAAALLYCRLETLRRLGVRLAVISLADDVWGVRSVGQRFDVPSGQMPARTERQGE
jgi:hypothetical protein